MQYRLTSEQYAFIKYLTSLNKEEDRGALAVLRRGVAGDPLLDLNLRRLIAHKVPDEVRDTPREGVYYLVAALYGFHPWDTDTGNFGDHMKRISKARSDSDAAERRFTALINARLSDLNAPLRQAVMMIRQQQEQRIPINWSALLVDLLRWDHPQKISQRAWANSFWAYERPPEPTDTPSNDNQKEK